MNYFYNDLYPNTANSSTTASETIPESGDKQALEEENTTATVNKDVTPNKKRKMLIALGLVVAVFIFLGGVK